MLVLCYFCGKYFSPCVLHVFYFLQEDFLHPELNVINLLTKLSYFFFKTFRLLICLELWNTFVYAVRERTIFFQISGIPIAFFDCFIYFSVIGNATLCSKCLHRHQPSIEYLLIDLHLTEH